MIRAAFPVQSVQTLLNLPLTLKIEWETPAFGFEAQLAQGQSEKTNKLLDLPVCNAKKKAKPFQDCLLPTAGPFVKSCNKVEG